MFLAELAEAAIQVGLFVREQVRKTKKLSRPVFGLRFYSVPILIAITVGNNGYVVGMSPRSMDLFDETGTSY